MDLDPATLDAILVRQLLVAWAGESLAEPPRLGWWDSDIVDPDGGGYFLKNLLPRTHKWAALQSLRELGRRHDAEQRASSDRPHNLLSLYHWGALVDEQLDQRLLQLKESAEDPAQCLPWPTNLNPWQPFEQQRFEDYLAQEKPNNTETPGGRRIAGARPDDLLTAAEQLCGAMLPLPDRYPAPYYLQDRG